MMIFSSNLSETFGTLEEEDVHSLICALDIFSLCWAISQLCTQSLYVNRAIKHLFLEPLCLSSENTEQRWNFLLHLSVTGILGVEQGSERLC